MDQVGGHFCAHNMRSGWESGLIALSRSWWDYFELVYNSSVCGVAGPLPRAG